jgi:hypothetical protein
VRVQVHADRIDIMLDQDRVCLCLDETAKQTERALTTTSRWRSAGAWVRCV